MMEQYPEDYVLPHETPLHPIPFWTLVTAASLGKQIGVLEERFKHDRKKTKVIGKLEQELEDLLFNGTGNTVTFMAIALKLEELVQA